MTDAASPSNASTIVEISEEYPYPSDVILPDFVTTKLGGKDTYNKWETQIVSLIKNHQMFGFINGELPSPAGNGKGKEEDIVAWTRSDALVKSWILGSLSKDASRKVVNHLKDKQKKTDFTAKDLWDELQRSYGPSALTWNPSIIVEVGKVYPYASHVSVPSFVTAKLSGKNKYNLWQTQMLCLLKSHQMFGFINGQFPCPAGYGKGIVGDMEAWTISDSLVKGWILGSLSEEAARQAVNNLTQNQKETDFTAKDLWDKLQRSYGPPVREQAAEIKAESVIEVVSSEEGISKDVPKEEKTDDEKILEKDNKEGDKKWLYVNVLRGHKGRVIAILEEVVLKPWDKIANNGNTILHVAAVGSSTKNHELLEKLLEMTKPEEHTLLDLINSEGSTLLHVAAIGGNTEAVNMLVERNPELLLAKDKEGHIPLALSVSNMHKESSQCLFHHMIEKEYNDPFSGKSGEDLVVLAISCQDFSLAKMIIGKYPDAIVSDSDVVLTTLAQNFPRELNYWERRDFMEDLIDRLLPYVPMLESVEELFLGLRIFYYIIWFVTIGRPAEEGLPPPHNF